MILHKAVGKDSSDEASFADLDEDEVHNLEVLEDLRIKNSNSQSRGNAWMLKQLT